MAELKLCPFCGSTEIYAEVSYLTKEFRKNSGVDLTNNKAYDVAMQSFSSALEQLKNLR